MRLVTSNRPLRELVAEAKAEVMEEIEDDREEGEEDDAMELNVVPNPIFLSFLSLFFFPQRKTSERLLAGKDRHVVIDNHRTVSIVH